MFGRKKRTQVVVVGAGPGGRLLALALARSGVEVCVYEQGFRETARSYAAAVHQSSLALLEELGLTSEVLKQALKVRRVGFYDRTSEQARLSLASVSETYPFVAVIPQSRLELLLDEELRRREVPVEFNHRVAGLAQRADAVTVTVDVLERYSSGYAYAHTEVGVRKTIEVDADYVIGADGVGSLTRRLLKIPYEELGQMQEFDVFEFASVAKKPDEARIVLDAGLSNVLWPLPGGRQRFSFEVANPSTLERERHKSRLAMQAPGEASPRYGADALRQLIAERASFFDEDVDDIAWAGDVRFERRLAQKLGVGRVYLLGDAVHQTGPIGVQSMNAGLGEALELAARLSAVLRDGADAGLLDEYARTVHARWSTLLRDERRYVAGEGASPWVSAHASEIVGCLPLNGPDLALGAGELGLRAPS
jgi:2-polyprenyl-6-methoxyphenol hydroxylase-like FAD-dependent oxidoreductase